MCIYIYYLYTICYLVYQKYTSLGATVICDSGGRAGHYYIDTTDMFVCNFLASLIKMPLPSFHFR